MALGRHPLLATSMAIAITAAGCAGGSRTTSPPAPAGAQAPLAATARDTTDRFYSVTAGFGITKPRGWVFGTVMTEEANRERVSLGHDSLDQQIRQHATAPLVVILKHPEPFDDLNPSVKVALRPAGQIALLTPREIAAAVLEGLRQSIPSYEPEGMISDALVGGREAAYFRSRFTVRQAGGDREFSVRSRTWVVPRGSSLFIIGMSGPPGGEDESEKEFGEILRSIEIRD